MSYDMIQFLHIITNSICVQKQKDIHDYVCNDIFFMTLFNTKIIIAP